MLRHEARALLLRASARPIARSGAAATAASASRLASSASGARRVAPVLVSPLLRKAKMGSLLAAGSTGAAAACAFCSAAAPPPPAVAAAGTTEWPRVTLYQYEPCPYCCKVKAVLDYLKIPYRVVEVNPLTKKETKAFTDYKKVPVMRIGDDEIVVDSSAIIARLRELAVARGVKDAVSDGSGVSFEDEEKWRKWVDEKLIVMTPPNIYRTVPEALDSFEYILTEGKFTPLERQLSKYSGAVVMYLIAKRSKKKYGIDDEREALYAALNAWVDAVGAKRPFLGGSEPNMADLSVFGVLRAMEGLQTYDDLMQHSSIKPWFQRMHAKVGASTRVSSA